MDSNPSNITDACLQTLRYFGIFKYPLSVEEIYQFNRTETSLAEIKAALSRLLEDGTIYQSGKFFLLEDNEDWVIERIKGNERASRLLERSGRYASVIASFPFVRGIAISGSLSKYYASEDPDIDYFIITDTNRLWIARSLLHLFKKLTFVTGHQHYFCMNYFVDTSALKIIHPNLYTSIEVATLLPVYHAPLLEQFLVENRWIREYLPNHPGMVDFKYMLRRRRQPVKKILEWIIRCLFPASMNRSLMKLTDWKWRRKWRRAGYPESAYDKAFYTDLHISKNHPVDFEKKVLKTMSQYQTSVKQSN